MVGSWCEKCAELLILEDGIKDENFINCWFSTFISDSCQSSKGEECEVDFPDHSLGHHEETEACVAKQSPGPSIIWSMESMHNLMEIVITSQWPFSEIVLENIIRVVEGIWVAVGLFSFSSISSSEDSLIIIEVVSISAVGWLKSFIVETLIGWFSSTSWAWSWLWGSTEESLWWSDEHSLAHHWLHEKCFWQHFYLSIN